MNKPTADSLGQTHEANLAGSPSSPLWRLRHNTPLESGHLRHVTNRWRGPITRAVPNCRNWLDQCHLVEYPQCLPHLGTVIGDQRYIGDDEANAGKIAYRFEPTANDDEPPKQPTLRRWLLGRLSGGKHHAPKLSGRDGSHPLHHLHPGRNAVFSFGYAGSRSGF